MTTLNWGRVVSGGVVAGFVIFLFGAIVTPMLPETWTTAMTAIGSDFTDPSEAWPVASIVAGSAIQLGMGVVLVWLYAAIRPRYGPGPRTAVIAGLALWVIVGLQVVSFVVLGSFSFGTFTVLHGPYVVGFILAGVAGAWVYKEDGGDVGPSAAA